MLVSATFCSSGLEREQAVNIRVNLFFISVHMMCDIILLKGRRPKFDLIQQQSLQLDSNQHPFRCDNTM